MSTDEQSTALQVSALRAAGCETIREDQMSGARRDRPELTRLLADVRRGNTIVVYKIDRLARSLSHLLEVIEDLGRRGVAFRSLTDPIDTASASGKFTLQILGAVAEFERALIRERTKAGVEAARARGRTPGNPGLRSGDPAMARKVAAAAGEALDERMLAEFDDWAPVVRQMRPGCAWGDVAAVLCARGADWTAQRLQRACRRAARAGLLDRAILGRAERREPAERLAAVAIGAAGPEMSLSVAAERLQKMGERTPGGGRAWSEAAVRRAIGGANVSV